ncbi:MAG TPA: pitrilysin family protein [Kofleriaceae bacterium]|nr:pitrilysin family protein [Kofleriaceae bacterium]
MIERSELGGGDPAGSAGGAGGKAPRGIDADDLPPSVQFEGDAPHLATRVGTLPCGLDVVVHRDTSSPQVAINVWYRVGSSDERPDRTGFAHLFEHLFKSPAERLGGHHYEVLRRAGATEANASTSADRTAYHEILPAHQLALALWLESERMGYFARDFDAERLVAQQAVVRAERRQRYEDVPYGTERFAVGLALYPEGHPLRHLTIGRHDDIQAATVEDVLAFYRTWYVPANATLVIAGDVGPDAELDALVDRYFGSFPASRRPVRPVPPPPLPGRGADRVVDRFAALGRIHRAWLGPAAFGDDEAELDVVTAAWVAPGTGAIWRRLVYETQLAQRVSAWTVNGRLGGEVHVAVDLRSGADPGAVRATLDELCRTGIDERAIERAVTRREAGAIWGLTGVARRAALIQRYMLYRHEPDGLAAELAQYRAVTPASVDRAIARWLDPAREIEIETVAGAPGGAAGERVTDPASAP